MAENKCPARPASRYGAEQVIDTAQYTSSSTHNPEPQLTAAMVQR